MKIITLTTHSAHNFGAVLQAYALQKYLLKMGQDAKILDYRPGYLKHNLIKFNPKEKIAKQVASNFLAFSSRLKRRRKFNEFINNHLELEGISYDKSGKIIESQAIYIVGSDQIWNDEITNGLDGNYFLDFVKHSKKTSYSASFGKEEITCDKEKIVNYLESFDCIAVRESSGKKILQELGFDDVKVTLDPVFLLDKLDYKMLSEKPTFSDYLLIYTLENNENIIQAARKISKEKNLKIVTIGSYLNRYKSDIHLRSTGPKEFLGLIDNAEYILTNSFHAVCFSIIFEKQFTYIDLNNNRGTRIENILNVCKLSNRKLSKLNDHTGMESIDYKLAKQNLKVELSKSTRFLNEIINKKI